jgi:hypothetical protein
LIKYNTDERLVTMFVIVYFKIVIWYTS